MTFEETQTIIKEFIEGNQNIINEDQCKSLNELLEIIYKDIEGLSKTGKFENNPLVFREALDTVVGISQIVLSGPLTNEFSTFILSFSELVFNWNNNTYKDSIISILVKFMTNTINSRNEMLHTIEVVKAVEERLNIVNGWSPSAFDIAIAYVDEQLKINEEKKGVV